jgi:hypothetical protein
VLYDEPDAEETDVELDLALLSDLNVAYNIGDTQESNPSKVDMEEMLSGLGDPVPEFGTDDILGEVSKATGSQILPKDEAPVTTSVPLTDPTVEVGSRLNSEQEATEVDEEAEGASEDGLGSLFEEDDSQEPEVDMENSSVQVDSVLDFEVERAFADALRMMEDPRLYAEPEYNEAGEEQGSVWRDGFYNMVGSEDSQADEPEVEISPDEGDLVAVYGMDHPLGESWRPEEAERPP